MNTEQKKKTMGDWPKGSSNKSQAAVSIQFSFGKKYASIEFDKINKDAREMNKWVRKGTYDKIINHAQAQYNIPEHTKLSKKMIFSWLKPNHKLLIAHPGPSLPMLKVELILLEMLLQLSDMNAPVTCREGL